MYDAYRSTREHGAGAFNYSAAILLHYTQIQDRNHPGSTGERTLSISMESYSESALRFISRLLDLHARKYDVIFCISLLLFFLHTVSTDTDK